MIDYANFSKQLRVKHFKMRIQIHAKLVANAQILIHTHTHTNACIFAFKSAARARHTFAHSFPISSIFGSLEIFGSRTNTFSVHTQSKRNIPVLMDAHPLFSVLFQLVIDNIMRVACIFQQRALQCMTSKRASEREKERMSSVFKLLC